MRIEKINQAIIDEMDSLGMFGPARDCFGEVVKSEGGVVRYRNSKQRFVLDGDMAYDVTPFGFYVDDKYDSSFCASLYYRPVVVGGCVFMSQPEEGQGGMLTEITMIHPNRGARRWFGWITERWLHTRELDLTPVEIEQNISDDVMAGHNYITGIPQRG